MRTPHRRGFAATHGGGRFLVRQGVDALRVPVLPTSQLGKSLGRRGQGSKFWHAGFISRANAEFVARMV
jgi:hypothetical protein